MIQYNSEDLQKKTRKIFKEWYEEYKRFIGEANLPKYDLKFYYNTEHCRSSCDHPNDPINEIHIITINELLLPTHGENAKAIAFHEFTHIFDSVQFYQFFRHPDIKNYNLAYTEFHAVQVQLKCAFGFEQEYDNKQIISTDLVRDGEKTKDVNTYIQYIKINLVKTINYLYGTTCDIPIDVRFVEVIRHSIYYCAIAEFFNCYMLEKVDFDCTDNFLKIVLGNRIECLFAKLKNFNIYDLKDYKYTFDLWLDIGKKITHDIKSKLT